MDILFAHHVRQYDIVTLSEVVIGVVNFLVDGTHHEPMSLRRYQSVSLRALWQLTTSFKEPSR